jgi:hypothetical protein
MKNLILILAVIVAALSLPGCNNCPEKSPPANVILEYHIGIIDTVTSSPFRYFAKFNDYPNEYEITPSSVFDLTYPYTIANDDSVVVKVIAKSGAGNVMVAWYKEALNFEHRACNDTLYMSAVLHGPKVSDIVSVPGPSTQPVPITITNPPSETHVP